MKYVVALSKRVEFCPCDKYDASEIFTQRSLGEPLVCSLIPLDDRVCVFPFSFWSPLQFLSDSVQTLRGFTTCFLGFRLFDFPRFAFPRSAVSAGG